MRFEHTVGRILELAAAAVPSRLSVTLGDETRTFAQSGRPAASLRTSTRAG